MPFIIAGCAVIGLIASRSIVAESDAHRRSESDAWLSPSCEVCGGSLTITMRRCVDERHPQRLMNAIVIVVTALTFGAVAASVDSLWLVPAYLSYSYVVVLLTVTDIDTKLLPNRILGPGTVVSGSLLVVGGIASGGGWDLARGIAAGVVYFVVMLILALVARGALGMGDVKLAFLLGLFVGYLGWGYLVIAGLGAFILGGLVSIVLLAARRVSRKDSIPFGPFLTSASVIAIVLGSAIITWYTG
jgi:leader peptidase (prepilin peptidase)/N-methyltransferase